MPGQSKITTPTTLRIPNGVLRAAEATARLDGRTVSRVLTDALKEALQGASEAREEGG